jgi:hypothetical protein
MSDDMARQLIDAVYFLASCVWRSALALSLVLVGIFGAISLYGDGKR